MSKPKSTDLSDASTAQELAGIRRAASMLGSPALKISDAQDMLCDVKQLIMAMDIALGYADFDESLSAPIQVVGRAAREKIDEIKRLLEESGAQLREGATA